MTENSPATGQPIEVYYNAVCPVCDAGVNENRRAIEKSGCAADARWIDVSSQPDALQAEGIVLDDVRRNIRVRDAQGNLHRGADAVAIMWLATPGRRWLGHLVQFPLIRPIARFAYFRFADILYWWNKRKGRW